MAARRIGLFGGTFDPPHLAHLAVAEAARDQAGLATVIWIPSATSPFKSDREGTAPPHRVAMVRLATRDNPAFEVSTIEIERGGLSYTVDTLEQIALEHPRAELRLIVGEDGLAGFPRWRNPERILELAGLLVYPRRVSNASPIQIPDWVKGRVTSVTAPEIDLSATGIREMVGVGRSVRYLVPDAVREYIIANRLYAR